MDHRTRLRAYQVALYAVLVVWLVGSLASLFADVGLAPVLNGLQARALDAYYPVVTGAVCLVVYGLPCFVLLVLVRKALGLTAEEVRGRED